MRNSCPRRTKSLGDKPDKDGFEIESPPLSEVSDQNMQDQGVKKNAKTDPKSMDEHPGNLGYNNKKDDGDDPDVDGSGSGMQGGGRVQGGVPAHQQSQASDSNQGEGAKGNKGSGQEQKQNSGELEHQDNLGNDQDTNHYAKKQVEHQYGNDDDSLSDTDTKSTADTDTGGSDRDDDFGDLDHHTTTPNVDKNGNTVKGEKEEPKIEAAKKADSIPKHITGDHDYPGAGDAGVGETGAGDAVGLGELGDVGAVGQFGYDVVKKFDPNIDKQIQKHINQDHLNHFEKLVVGSAKQVGKGIQDVETFAKKHLSKETLKQAADTGNLFNEILSSGEDVAGSTEGTKSGIEDSKKLSDGLKNAANDIANDGVGILTTSPNDLLNEGTGGMWNIVKSIVVF